MKKSQRLQNIANVAEHKEEESGRQLAQSRHHSDQQHQQLQQLCRYRDEYNRQFQELGAEGMNARQLADFRAFLGKLNDAIKQQEQTAENAQATLNNSHRMWLEAHQRVKALNKAVEKRRADEWYEENRREQIESDEFGSRTGGVNS